MAPDPGQHSIKRRRMEPIRAKAMEVEMQETANQFEQICTNSLHWIGGAGAAATAKRKRVESTFMPYCPKPRTVLPSAISSVNQGLVFESGREAVTPTVFSKRVGCFESGRAP